MRVLGRVEELAALDTFLEAITDPTSSQRVGLLTGEAGIGKTALWEEGRSRAAGSDFTVLTARPAEPEATLGFAALADLLEEVPSTVIDGLPAPQRHALRVALLREEVGDAAADPRSVATATLNVLRRLATLSPVLLAVDDLPWLDASSRRVLAFALRRTGSERIGVLATVRTEAGNAPTLLTDGVPQEYVVRIAVGPLTLGAERELLADRLGFAPAHRTLVHIHDTSGGNPYFALELGRVLVRGDAGRSDALPVPESLRRLVEHRLADLSPQVREVLLAAALAPTASADLVIAAARQPASARAHLEDAQEAGFATVGERVDFDHPLLRSMLIADASPGLLRSTHARLAAVMPPVASARHRALAAEGPDEDVARALDAAVVTSQQRGAPDTAADLAELAIRMTPPNAADARWQRTLAAAQLRFESGDPPAARSLIHQLVAEEPSGPRRAGALLPLAKYQRYAGDPLPVWQQTLVTALGDAAPEDVPTRIAIHLGLGLAALNGGDLESAPEHVAAIIELSEGLDDRFLDARAAASLAYVRFIAGEGVSETLVTRALAEPPQGGRVSVEESATYTVATMLAHAGDPQRARALVERDLADANERGDEISLPILLWLLVVIETWYGNWSRADALAEQAMRAALLSDNPVGASLVGGARAILRAAQGREADALADAQQASEFAAMVGLALPQQLAAEACGLVALGRGDWDAAHDAMWRFTEAGFRVGAVEVGVLHAVPLEVEALVRRGDLDTAEDVMSAYGARPQLAGPSWPSVALARCGALLRAARGDLATADAEIRKAVEDAASIGMPFEEARALFISGEIHRRARRRRRAQDALARAERLFAELGAAVWAARCREELARAGAPSRTADEPDTLTATEGRVAELAALGYTTREIAATLFASIRTVETHLQNVYRKLGVRSRVELTRLLGEAGDKDKNSR